jgi:hypothetical protein
MVPENIVAPEVVILKQTKAAQVKLKRRESSDSWLGTRLP